MDDYGSPTNEIEELRFSLRSMAAALKELAATSNAMAMQIRKMEEHQASSDKWIHRLLNPQEAQE